MDAKTTAKGSHKYVTTFIDIDEIEEMLAEYYDFEAVSEEQWSALDHQISIICEEHGISSDYSEEYVRICDMCCERLRFPTSPASY